jgi:excisionase family DNA binding protein
MIKFKVIEMAKAFGVHRNTVTNWIKKGTLNAKPIIGRKYVISEEDLIAFAELNNIPQEVIDELIEKNKINNLEDQVLKGNQVLKGRRVISQDPKGIRLKTNQREMIMKEQKPIGSVLVVGGGIAGIQAVLDLADSGYYVHLVERSSGIGGVMAQLDKTFPTNDCAM